MPHFENIEQYESSKTRNGRKQIMPIAPHSLQATEYRPRKQERPRAKESLKAPAFPEVEFEPVSVSQMEKEFRQAGKTIARPRRKKVGLKKRISGMWNALLSLVAGKQKPTKKIHKAANRRRRPESKEDAPKNKKSGGPKTEGQRNKRGNRRRSNPPPQGSGDKPAHNKHAGGEQNKDGPGKDSRRRSQRSRRGNRSSGRQQSKPGSQKDSQNKSS